MAYYQNTTSPSDASNQPNATDAAASSIARTTWPYSRHADVAVQQPILLRPPTAPAASSDPLIEAINSVQDVMQRVQRSTRLIAAPWLIEPPDSESLHLAGGILMPAQDGAFHTVLQVICPPGRNGVINQIANVVVGGAWSDFSGDAIWQIVRNPGNGITAAERNYEDIESSLGLIVNPARVSGIRIFENDVMQWLIKNVNLPAAGEEVGALFGGYFYPRTWDDQFEASDQSITW